MLPDRIIEVIQGPAIMYAGTRDERLRPAQTYVVGAIVHPDRETVTFFVPESCSEKILSNLKNNGRVALAIGLVTHEAYQLKGVHISSRPVDVKERAVQEIYRSKVLSALLQAGYPEQIAKPYVLNQTTKHSYTTLVVLLMVAQPSWLRAQAGGLCHQDCLSGTVPSSCGSI